MKLLRYQIADAKRLMADGMSMAQAADLLGLLRADLDAALWRNLGVQPDAISIPPRRRAAA